MKKESDQAYAARKLREVIASGVRAAEEEARFSVVAAKKDADETLRITAEVRQRLGLK